MEIENGVVSPSRLHVRSGPGFFKFSDAKCCATTEVEVMKLSTLCELYERCAICIAKDHNVLGMAEARQAPIHIF